MLPDNLNKLAMRLILFKDNQPLTSLQHGFSTLSHVEACLVNDAVTFIWQAITELLAAIRQLMHLPEPRKRPIGFVTHD